MIRTHEAGPARTSRLPDPERILAAAQMLATVYRLFGGNPLALKIMRAWPMA